MVNDRAAGWPEIIVVGGASTDFVAYGPCIPRPGEELHGEQFVELCGGKGANQAVAVARLGGTTAFVGRVGTDARGQALRAHLEREGVDTRACRSDPAAPTSAIVLMIDHDDTKATLTVPGATGRIGSDDITNARDLLDHARILVIQFEAPLPVVQTAIELAHRAGCRIFLDAAPVVSIPTELWSRVYVARLNAGEASKFTGIEVTDRDSAGHAARSLIERGVQVVAIQAGPGGNLLTWPEGEVFLPIIDVRPFDKTGAGDAFIAALAVAHLEGQGWSEAGRFANAAAALTTTQLGAEPGLPRRTAVMSLLEKLHAGSQRLEGS